MDAPKERRASSRLIRLPPKTPEALGGGLSCAVFILRYEFASLLLRKGSAGSKMQPLLVFKRR